MATFSMLCSPIPDSISINRHISISSFRFISIITSNIRIHELCQRIFNISLKLNRQIKTKQLTHSNRKQHKRKKRTSTLTIRPDFKMNGATKTQNPIQ